MGYLPLNKVLWLGLPAIITALIATNLVVNIPDFYLQIGFGSLVIINIYLTQLKRKLVKSGANLLRMRVLK